MKKISIKTKAKAKLMMAQVYWNMDQAYKRAEAARNHTRDLVLIALRKGETAGPAYDDDDMSHWLTHGEKERVEISPRALAAISSLSTPELLDMMQVNVALLKEKEPTLYDYMLKHKTTRRTRHSCLTWSATAPAPRPKRRVRGAV